MRVIYIGTLAPATSGWWHDLVADGSHGSTYVQALQGDPAKWDHIWAEITPMQSPGFGVCGLPA